MPMRIAVDPELHFEEVLSVASEPRSQFETFQPTSVLAGQELSKQLEPSLGATLERVTLGDDIVSRLEGKSSLGRLGLQVHSTAGFIDPGFDGHVTLELANVANLPITLYPDMKIGQMSFMDLDQPAEKPYGSGALGSKYQGQVGPTPSAYWRNFQS